MAPVSEFTDPPAEAPSLPRDVRRRHFWLSLYEGVVRLAACFVLWVSFQIAFSAGTLASTNADGSHRHLALMILFVLGVMVGVAVFVGSIVIGLDRYESPIDVVRKATLHTLFLLGVGGFVVYVMPDLLH